MTEVVGHPEEKAPAHLGDRDDLAAQVCGEWVNLRRVAVTLAGEPHKAAGAALGQMVLLHHSRDRRTLGLWG